MSNLFKRLFNKLRRRTGSEELQVREFSQGHVLKAVMSDSRIKHGETVMADLNMVRIERTTEDGINSMGELTLFFCPLYGIKVTERLSAGDNEPLPEMVELHNFTVPRSMESGLYEFKNILLHANGKINVTTTENTTMEKIGG